MGRGGAVLDAGAAKQLEKILGHGKLSNMN
jgi:hypothetical protein